MIFHGPFLSRSSEILLGRGFHLGQRLDAFLRGEERGEEKGQANHRPDRHGHLPAVLPVMADGELGDERQRETTDDELRDVHGDKAERVEPGAFVEIGGHDTAQRRIRHVVHRVERHQHRVGDDGVGDHGPIAPAFGRGVGEDHDHGPRDRRPQNPRPEPAPAGAGSVRQHTHDRIEQRVPQTRPEQDGGRGAGRQPEHVGVEIQLEQDHRHEDEVRGGVASAVSDLLADGEFLGTG